MKKSLLTLVPVGVGISIVALAAVDPSSVKLKVYAVAVSTSADCSNPLVVFSSDVPTETDMAQNPTLGTGTVPDGTYQCVMITISDQVKATPKTTEGACIAGAEFSGGVCQDNESTNLLGGTTFGPETTCTAGEDKVTLYLTTGTTRTKGGGALLKPTSTADPDHGLALAQPWVVSGTSTGTFVVDFTGKVGPGGGECGVDPPLFGFR
jgi:hypothetical protein